MDKLILKKICAKIVLLLLCKLASVAKQKRWTDNFRPTTTFCPCRFCESYEKKRQFTENNISTNNSSFFTKTTKFFAHTSFTDKNLR